jgi:hypothetical protein
MAWSYSILTSFLLISGDGVLPVINQKLRPRLAHGTGHINQDWAHPGSLQFRDGEGELMAVGRILDLGSRRVASNSNANKRNW